MNFLNNPIELKKQLYTHCVEYVTQRIDTAKQAMEAAQAAANEESKSSAGDKYETTRAMMQIERDRHAAQLAEAFKLKKELESLNVDKQYDKVQAGSLVITDQNHFFLSISVGKITLNKIDYFAVSLNSPIGVQLLNLKAGSEFRFQNRFILIKEVF